MRTMTRPGLALQVRWAVLGGFALIAASAAVPIDASGLDSFVLSRADLRYDNAPRRANGKVKLQAFVDDNNTSGELDEKLLADQVVLVVTDSTAFNTTIQLTGCARKAEERVKCISDDKSVRAKFLASKQGPFLYNMWVTVRRLSEEETGSLQPTGPVTVRLLYDGIDRGADIIYACEFQGRRAVFCRDP